MNRFFITDEICLDAIVNIQKKDINHIKNVLRMKKNDLITVVSQAKVALAELDDIQDDAITARIKEILPENNEAPIKIILAQGLSKGDKMDFVVQKAVELGVSEIIPLNLQRSVVSYDDKKSETKQQRWQDIAEGAAKQSKRNVITYIHPVMNLKTMLEQISFDKAIVAYEQEGKQSLKACLKSTNAKTILLIIGPEGGITDREMQFLQENNAQSITLGKRILRTETAAVVLTSLVMYELGDLGGFYE